ncbi:MAG TPA: hypothetical protein VIK33_08980 [Anaerolineae bacterium]
MNGNSHRLHPKRSIEGVGARGLAARSDARRGAEEITRQLNAVYDALIDDLHGYGGSVIGDPGIQLIDALAGSILDQLIAAGRHAGKGEVVLAPSADRRARRSGSHRSLARR